MEVKDGKVTVKVESNIGDELDKAKQLVETLKEAKSLVDEIASGLPLEIKFEI